VGAASEDNGHHRSVFSNRPTINIEAGVFCTMNVVIHVTLQTECADKSS
jgi:hypothetical protein